MYKIAIITHKETNCGVHNFAKTTYDILSKSTKYQFEFVTVNDIQDLAVWYTTTDADAIVWNYHHDTLKWVTKSLSEEITLPQFMITGHDVCTYYPTVLAHFVCDPTFSSELFTTMPRPVPYDLNIVYTPPGPILKIGSFGFGQYSKNFPGVVRMVNDQFIEPVVVNLHIPYGNFVDASGALAHEIADQCRAIANINVKLNITHDFKTNEEVIQFLNGNDINIFNYDDQPGRGVSSCIDFALAARKPFAISDSSMYRHVAHNTNLLLSKNKIKDIVKNSIIPLEEFYNAWSAESFISAFEQKFDQFLSDNLTFHVNHMNHVTNKPISRSKFKFPYTNFNKINTSYSQAGQDLFVLAVHKGKVNGTYFEIGSNDPVLGSNTYLLERTFFWKGTSVDIDLNCVLNFNTVRQNKTELFDARTVDVKSALERAGINDLHIDYLSVDCEPAYNTYIALLNIPFDKLKFAVLTYEHDGYIAGDECLKLSREHLTNLGYVLVVSKLAVTDTAYFEDWWVHPDLVDMEHVSKMIANDDSIKYFEHYLFNQ
jgi:hypothetical protein